MTAGSAAPKKITAIVRTDRLDALERRLKTAGVPGITVDAVKGYGEFPEFAHTDWLSRHARIEIVADGGEAPWIVDIILEIGHTGMPGDGIVYVEPVAEVHRIRDRHFVKAG